jgi:hypothetical protein
MLLGETLLGEDLLESMLFEATFTNTYAFDYLAGTTVTLTTKVDADTCTACMYKVYAGQSLSALVEIPDGIKTAVLFTSNTSGSTNIYIRIVLMSTNYGTSPVFNSIGLLIEQQTSLYTIATKILDDGLTPISGTWSIDTELQKYLIPYAWFDTVKHRFALGKVAEATGGVAYQDRYGVVRLDAGNYLTRQSTANLYYIGEDEIYDASSPVSVIANRVQVKTKPYVALSEMTLWTLQGDATINNGESKTYLAYYTDHPAAIDQYAELVSDPVGASIASETHYAWGSSITILGSADGQVLTLTVEGKPIELRGARLVERSDGSSIRRNGDKTLTLDDNNMIQSGEVAGIIADAILDTTAQKARDILTTWRGDPSIELGDKGEVTGYEVVLVENRFTFDGMLECKSRFRRV